MVNKVFVVAGGRGTRSVNPRIPKVLQDIHSGLKLIDFHLENLYRSKLWHVTFLLNYGCEEIRESLANRKNTFRNFSFRFRHDRPGESLSQLVSNAIREDTEEGDLFVVTLGDVLQNINYQKHLNHLKGTDYLGTVLVHPNLHPHESDVFEVGWHHSPPKLRLKGHERSELSPTKAVGGIYFLRSESLEFFSAETGTIAGDLLAPLHKARKLAVVNSVEYFQDTGTELRLQKAKEAVASGEYKRRGTGQPCAIFLDRDGTLVPDVGPGRLSILESEVQSEDVDAIRLANRSGIPVFLVTNQPGIAKGFLTEAKFLKTQFELEKILANQGAIIDDFEFCPHHPEIGFDGEVRELKFHCNCRKPENGMIMKLAEKHSVNLSKSYFFGDSQADEQAATKSGMHFKRVLHGTSCDFSLSKNIREAVERITQ
jgi:mannose-1-phosphate guanylyltransferase/phosphomannomutase